MRKYNIKDAGRIASIEKVILDTVEYKTGIDREEIKERYRDLNIRDKIGEMGVEHLISQFIEQL